MPKKGQNFNAHFFNRRRRDSQEHQIGMVFGLLSGVWWAPGSSLAKWAQELLSVYLGVIQDNSYSDESDSDDCFSMSGCSESEEDEDKPATPPVLHHARGVVELARGFSCTGLFCDFQCFRKDRCTISEISAAEPVQARCIC